MSYLVKGNLGKNKYYLLHFLPCIWNQNLKSYTNLIGVRVGFLLFQELGLNLKTLLL